MKHVDGKVVAGVLFVLVVAVAIVAQMVNQKHEHPLVFARATSYEQAMDLAQENDRLLIVDFMADWCGPCKQMDKTTWVDTDVTRWVNDYAVAVQVDVDKDPEISGQYSITALPTILVLDSATGTELGRQVGYRSVEELLPWLEATRVGGGEEEEEFEEGVEPETTEDG